MGGFCLQKVITPFMIPLDTALSYVTLNFKFFINLKLNILMSTKYNSYNFMA